MEDSISARSVLDPDAIADGLEAHQRQLRSGFERVFLKCLLSLLALASIGIPLAVLMPPGAREGKWVVLLTLIALFGFLWTLIYQAFWSRATKLRTARKSLQGLSPEALLVEWTFTQEYILVQTGLSASTLRWPFFIKFVEAPKGYVLYQGHNLLHWIPGRSFASSEAANRFAELARSQIPHSLVLGKCQGLAKPATFELNDF